jgi:4-carboxymuconolactone decarboxylase
MPNNAGPTRVSEIAEADLTAEQRSVIDAVRAGRGRLPTPFKIWLHAPDVAAIWGQLGTLLNGPTSLTPRERELATVAAVHRLHGAYVEEMHARHALELGLTPAVIDALRHEQTPQLDDPREAIVVTLALRAHDPQPIDDATFAKAVELIGHRGIAELYALIGYYSAVAIAMKTYRVPIPPQVQTKP